MSFLEPDSFIPRLHPAVTFWPEIKTFIWLSQQLKHVSYSSVKVTKTIATNDVCLKCLVSSLIKVPLASNKKEELFSYWRDIYTQAHQQGEFCITLLAGALISSVFETA